MIRTQTGAGRTADCPGSTHKKEGNVNKLSPMTSTGTASITVKKSIYFLHIFILPNIATCPVFKYYMLCMLKHTEEVNYQTIR